MDAQSRPEARQILSVISKVVPHFSMEQKHLKKSQDRKSNRPSQSKSRTVLNNLLLVFISLPDGARETEQIHFISVQSCSFA